MFPRAKTNPANVLGCRDAGIEAFLPKWETKICFVLSANDGNFVCCQEILCFVVSRLVVNGVIRRV